MILNAPEGAFWYLGCIYDILVVMTVRQLVDSQDDAYRIGRIIKKYRKRLTDIHSRYAFIESGSDLGLDPNWISEKSLASIENGLNMPSLVTLHNLVIALQVDQTDFLNEIMNAFND